VRPQVPQVMQFPMAQTIPVQIPITTGNGQTVYQTVHVPIQNFGNQMPQIIQPQMQIVPQFTQQVANIITPSGHIQQVQLANLPMMQQQAAQQQSNMQNAMQQQSMQTLKVDGSGQDGGQQNQQQLQPITITNAQGQQMTVIPAQQMRPNPNIIQIPNVPGMQSGIPTQIQHIPGIGNVQVISANALNGNFMTQPIQTIHQVPQSPVTSSASQVTIQPASTVTVTASTASNPIVTQVKQIEQQEPQQPTTKWIIKPEVVQQTPIVIQTSSAAPTIQSASIVTTQSGSGHQTTTILPAITLPVTTNIAPAKQITTTSSASQVTIQPAPVTTATATETKTTIVPSIASNKSTISTTISVTPSTVTTLQPTVSQTSVNVNINVSSDPGSGSAPEVKPRVRRVACTCPNCTMPDKSSDRKKQHICHVAGCNKVYGKTSHLR